MSMNHLLACVPVLGLDFERGEGPFLWDAEGRRYVDLESGSWAAALGHCDPRVTAVIERQAGRLVHLSVAAPNREAEAAAEAVLRVSGLDGGRCVFLSSGSEAVEFAVQAARRATGRPLMLRFSTSYLAAYGSSSRSDPEEWLILDWRKAAADPEATLAGLPFERLAGLALECGGSSTEFVDFPPEALVRPLCDRIRKAGGLVVCNEITTGIGRTGRWFGFMHYGVRPDAVAIGKGLGSGYPVSAAAFAPGLADAIERSGLRYAQSHQNDPLGCAVAREVLAAVEADRLVDRSRDFGKAFAKRIGEAARRAEARGGAAVKAIRGRGLLIAVELEDRGEAPAPDGAALRDRLRERGFLVSAYPRGYPAGTGIRLDPPLNLPEDIAWDFCSALEEALVD